MTKAMIGCAGGLLLLVGLIGGCKSTDHDHDHDRDMMEAKAQVKSEGPVNKLCPLMLMEVDPEATVDYKGEEVAFCCPRCVNAWKDMDEGERMEKLTAVRDSN